MAARKRVRVRKPKEALMRPDDREGLTTILDSILKKRVKAAQVLAEAKKEETALFAGLTKFGLTEWQGKLGKAEIVISKGRSSTVIHPAEFAELVDDEVFMECITVGVTKAKKHLSEKELKTVSTTTTAKDGDPTLKVEAFK